MLITVLHLGNDTSVTGCLNLRTELATSLMGTKQVSEERPLKKGAVLILSENMSSTVLKGS